MNAVERFASVMPSEGLRRVAMLAPSRFGDRLPAIVGGTLDLEQAHARVLARWGGDLCGLLNALVHAELVALARAHGVDANGKSPELRTRLWERGAILEAGGASVHDTVQPRPVLLGGHLVVQAPPRGLFPPSARWPRPLPDAVAARPPADEPDSVDDLLAAADRAIGVRLGARGADKGAWGLRAAALLGVVERGMGEPDWRGDVELKTVAISAERDSRLWRIVDDPAIAMSDERSAIAKLQRTLWLARADVPGGDATIVAWYLLEWDAPLARLALRYLHERPKGPAGTQQRALYLHKRFFADAGLLASLNGPV
ncbi:MAG TPA: hypothetical protein VH143_08360 [Kofleriaceae bacterium]|jgi:hypothetical protein|nr:hypothetical protein [Kofleriaceae bacterium]